MSNAIQRVERHPGPWMGPDAILAKECAMATIRDYGDFDGDTHQRVLKDGIWNDHVSVQAALAVIHTLRINGMMKDCDGCDVGCVLCAGHPFRERGA